MKVSEVKAVLTEEDLLSILKDFVEVEVEGLTFTKVMIDDLIIIEGMYKKGVSVPFRAKVGIGNVYDNILNVKIFDINVAKIGILNGIKDITLRALLKDFAEYGIKAEKNYLEIDMNLISKFIPYVYFNLKSVKIEKGIIEADVKDIIYAENKETTKIKKKDKKNVDVRTKDGYYKFRKKLEGNVPKKYDKLLEYAMLIPDITALLYRLFRDKRVSMKVKMKVAGVAAYLASPIDIIPDFIPFIGRIDDVGVAFFGLNSIINDVPENIILENWQGEQDIIKLIREGVSYISKAVGSENVSKLIDFIKKIGKKKEEDEEVNSDEKCYDIH
jgi:uncharacterized membrane protein YkvA (DUF1232 family)